MRQNQRGRRRHVSASRRELFDRYCRQPGTRIWAIMIRLERGETMESIAKRFKTSPQTINVYRKALEGKLSTGKTKKPQTKPTIMDIPLEQRVPDSREGWKKRGEMAIELRKTGMDVLSIARTLGLSYRQTRNLISRANRRMKNGGGIGTGRG